MEIIKGEIPFVRILLPFAAGICTAYFSVPSAALLTTCNYFISSLLLSLIYYVIFYKRHYNYNYRWIAGIILSLIIFLTGYNLTAAKSQDVNARHFSRSECEMLVITISSEPKLSGDILRFEADVQQGYKNAHFFTLEGKLLVALKPDSHKNYKYGDLLLIPASFTEIEAPYNPAEFNYKEYLADHGIHYQTFLNNGAAQLLHHNKGNPIVASAFRLREKLVIKFNKYIAGKDNAAVASTLILGYRADLSREILNAYSKTGTMHVLSVSGMHVSIVFIVMLFMLKFMDRSKKLQLIRAILIIILIWFYAILTGFSPAACRAALMLSFVILGKTIQRDQNTYNLLATSAVLLLIYDPFFLFDVGFQLSYIAVIGLVYIYPKIYQLFYIRNWLGDQIWSYISLSTAAQLATFPLSIYYFHQFPVYFLLSNLFIVLPVTFIMYAGLLFLFIPWNFLLIPIGWLLDKSIAFTNLGLFYIEDLPYANITGIWINAWTYLLIYIFLLAIIFLFLYRDKRLVYTALSAFFILTIILASGVISFYKSQIIFYSLRKNTGIGFFEDRKAIIITDLKADEKTFIYSIKPSIESNGIQSQNLLKPGTIFSENNFFYNGNFVQFRNWKLLIWDKIFDKKSFTKLITVDVILLHGNPRITIKALTKTVKFKTMLIDGSNPEYRIKNWQKEANEAGIKCYVLKTNPAYILNL
jgi:competence protein ComEC